MARLGFSGGLWAAVTAWLLVLAGVFCLLGPAAAEDKQEPPPAPEEAEAAEQEPGRRWPVLVVHEGDDLLGQRLALRFKESLDASPLFRLASPEEKAVKVLLTSRTEIGERPGFGSAYAAVWLYAEGKEVLAYYLDAVVGTVDGFRLDAESQRLAARTDKLTERYKYLFE